MRATPRHFLALAAALPLTACTPLGLAPVPQPVVPVASAAPAAPASVAPAAPVSRSVLDGVARSFGNPLVGASVQVFKYGETTPLATTTSGAEGKFRAEFPDAVAPGTMIAVVATLGDTRVASISEVPARRLLQADEVVVLDEKQTTALLVMGPRLLAALALGTAEARAKALQAFRDTTRALDGSADAITPAKFEQAVRQVLGEAGQVLATQESRETAAALIPADKVEDLKEIAEDLAETIRDAVDNGAPRPPDETLIGLEIGEDDVPPVFSEPGDDLDGSDDDGGSGGSGGGSKTKPLDDITVEVATPVEGTYDTPAGPSVVIPGATDL